MASSKTYVLVVHSRCGSPRVVRGLVSLNEPGFYLRLLVSHYSRRSRSYDLRQMAGQSVRDVLEYGITTIIEVDWLCDQFIVDGIFIRIPYVFFCLLGLLAVLV